MYKEGEVDAQIHFSVNNLGCSVGSSLSREDRQSSEFLSCKQGSGIFQERTRAPEDGADTACNCQPSAQFGWDEHKEIQPPWVASDTHRRRHSSILSWEADILLKCSAQCDGCPPPARLSAQHGHSGWVLAWRGRAAVLPGRCPVARGWLQ